MHSTFISKSKTTILAACILAAFGVSNVALAAGDHASKDEAVAMVKKGVVAAKAGKDKFFADVSAKKYKDRDLYLVVYGLDGKVLAHGANDKMVGKDLIGMKDIDGKEFVKERVDLAKSKGTFWQEYKFTNPESKKVEAKEAYCEKLDDYVICGGVYK